MKKEQDENYLWIVRNPNKSVILFYSEPYLFGGVKNGFWAVSRYENQNCIKLDANCPKFKNLTVENSPKKVKLKII